jgi:NADH-quinone oxidoreductase subunit L
VLVFLGFAVWWWRERLSGVTKALRGIGWAAANNFGFEAINREVVNVTQESAESLRVMQTGLLNWNVFGIIAGLVILLAILMLGAY